MLLISDNGVSRVWKMDNFIYKFQPTFMAVSELWCLEKMYPSGYVPWAGKHDRNTIKLNYISRNDITDFSILEAHFGNVLRALKACGIRHGDLTIYNIIIHDNHPYLVDFSESRLACDPRPDKRPEGDAYWLHHTLQGLKDGRIHQPPLP